MNRIQDDLAPEKTGADASRLSMWTVVGAVAASVMAAGILGSVSGILQIPGISGDVTSLKTAKEDAQNRLSTLSERMRSQELVGENLQRQLNVLSTRFDQLTSRLDARDQEMRNGDITLQRALGELDTRLSRGLSELEGRSKDRNTEAMGATNALQAAVSSLGERQKATGEALGALRQNVYDLATRAGRQTDLRFPGQPGAPTDMPPYSRSPIRPNTFRHTGGGSVNAPMTLSLGESQYGDTRPRGAAPADKQEANSLSNVRMLQPKAAYVLGSDGLALFGGLPYSIAARCQ